MPHLPISLLASELQSRGYETEGYTSSGRFEQEFLQLSHCDQCYCIGPFDGMDSKGEKLVDSSDLWICHTEDLEKEYSRDDKILPDTDDPYVLVNSIEAWIIREETMQDFAAEFQI